MTHNIIYVIFVKRALDNQKSIALLLFYKNSIQ